MHSVFGIAILYAMVIIELVVLRFRLKEPLPWKEVVLNLNSGHILMWVGRGVEVMGYAYVVYHFSLGWIEALPVSVQWVSAFILWDLCYYWNHRAHHAIPFLWNVHEVHHQGEHFSLSLGIRNSWYSSLTSFPFFLPLCVLGFPVEQFVVVGSVHYFIQFYNHNRLVRNSGVFEYLMVTPAHHIVHHGKNPEYLGKNCAGTFIIWDKLFGTFQEKLIDVPVQLGIREPIRSENPYWINNIPFFRYFNFGSPSFATRRKPAFVLSDPLIGAGGLLLFVWLLYYIYVEMIWDNQRLSFLFLIIFGSTISICGLSEGRYWGIITWLLFFCLGTLVFISFGVPSTALLILFALNCIHVALVLVAFFGQVRARKTSLL
ncbi:MAG: sterol desaturase family protein [Cyclobacteriaceae bacterium]|nr:sterol desaturase family protein [Cyclobacteriaceae bacterium]MDH4298745.1 sterol desaturase family protein [Cyclobacteriaceae bacterium]MDH5249590.1 sterol desaturase family protein [Cyclobacteriaceae bacterium]